MKLTRRSTLAALTGGLAMPYVRPSWAQAGTVNVYNWADYIGETTLADFEAATGIGVVYDLYSSSEEAQAKLLAGSSGYDVVLHAGMSMQRFIQAGVFQKLDKSKLPGLVNLDPELMKVADTSDPGAEYGVPYMWGSVGMTYNVDMVRERLGEDVDLSDLAILLDPQYASKLADCGISVLDSPTDFGYMAMKYLGIDPNTAGEAEYQKLAEVMAPVRQYITTFDNNNYLTTLPNEELCAANTWSGDYGVASARAAEAGIDINLAYFVPKTGSPGWFDFWVMPADAPNAENGHKFIDYMLQPEVIAACTNFTGYANANKAATAFVDPAIAADPAVYPDAEVMARMFTPLPQTDEQEEAMTRVWTKIKTGG
ncbi:polyamine ABC transporter substrate-binding protein [Xinfangfangia sp. CPCC 101601]|uniref:Putrescine-binding periplasmic protein n=1 Tax=Pseudogemmobacter lacusdianii TaxID=3069608 RepID=A0ABU0VSR0_9RHOB|nr:polyamine ABC transporter substrate-binding protein [Xinfangfangia sp. CPCC 101601]MDQ2064771.1 polyamine ABC transporter substrate-binding protein [Xinfangfangia sp. CPCC 101601]